MKRGTDLNIIISNAGGMPIYEQIVRQIKGEIMEGKLQTGDALPSIRLLAKELRISVITTKRAYEELERDGFIETVAGKGSFVAGQNAEFIREENLRQMEEWIAKAAILARESGVSLPELQEIVRMQFEE